MSPAEGQELRSPNAKGVAECLFLKLLPVEIRVKIYELVFADLISELSDNLFGVFSLYDFFYDYTQPSLESHIGKTGLTTLLHTCKRIHDEALEVLCNQAEFVLNIMGDHDSDDEERADCRFSEDSRLLEFAKNLNVNIEPHSDDTNERFVGRIKRFLDIIDCGANLRSLTIRISGPSLENPQSLDDILLALSKLRTAGNPILICIGELTQEVLSSDRLDKFVDTVGGINMGRGHHVLEPTHYEGEGEKYTDWL
ncbi:hypothetical protein F4802DRAFT_574805 [Xylaria palmicola]|nr:hypothetical protein F4802DRAFT_574805 [Xylaria palmicola]